MKIILEVSLLALIAIPLSSCSTCHTWKKDDDTQENSCSYDSGFQMLQTPNLKDCALACMKISPTCKGANYHHASGNCTLLDNRNLTRVVDCPGFTHTAVAEMDTGNGVSDLSSVTPGSYCADQWNGFGSHCYLIEDEELRFDAGAKACRERNADLVSIHSNAENQFLADLTGNHIFTAGMLLVNDPGLPVSEYDWVDGSSISYTNWRQTPNNDNMFQNCVYVEPNGDWVKGDCYEKKTTVCKRNAAFN